MTRASQRVAKEIADVLERDAHDKSKKDGIHDEYQTVWMSELRRWLLLLAPPRKKPIRRSKTSLKSRATVKELDALAREIVFLRDRGLCVWCGKPAVDWSHIYSRRYKWLRWDLDSSCAMCKGCHIRWHHKPVEGADFWRRYIGPRRYEALVLRASKPRKVSPELVRAYLEGERKKL